MALQEIPYTNLHNLNLDWIIKKIQEFEQRLEAIEDYGEEIADLQAAVANLRVSLETLKRSVNNSVTALNARCTGLEDEQDKIKLSIQQLYVNVAEDIADIESQFDAINAALRAIRTYNDSSNSVVLNQAKEYTREKVRELLEYFSDPQSIYVTNPWNNQIVTIQQMINYLYDLLHFAGMTAQEFDDLGLTAAEFDAIGLTAEEFDNYGRWAIFFRKAYVTTPELMQILENYAKASDIVDMATMTDLEHYATLNDIKVVNPVTGLSGNVQDALLSLANLHQFGLTCTQFDGMELTASAFDALNITAFEFDFVGMSFFASAGAITALTGLTASQWNDLYIGAGGQIYYIGG